jgi:transcriptional regulator with XRE-family HTH domain
MPSARLGELIRDARDLRQLSQLKLADRSGVSRDYISSIEMGRIAVIYPETANRLRESLGIQGWELLEAMGYETDVVEVRDANQELMRRISRLRPEQQEALLGLLSVFER